MRNRIGLPAAFVALSIVIFAGSWSMAQLGNPRLSPPGGGSTPTLQAVVDTGATSTTTITMNAATDIQSASNTNLVLSGNGSGYASIGGDTTNHGFNSANDLVTGKLEANEAAYFDSNVFLVDGNYLAIGNAGLRSDSRQFYHNYVYSTIKASTDDGLIIAPNSADGTSNRNLIISDYAWSDMDHDHDTPSATPTLFIHGASPDSDNTAWLSATFDGTDGILNTGKGIIKSTPAFQATDYYSGDGSQGATDSTSWWLCTAADCSTKCQVVVKDGLIISCA